jgi:prolyl-tRNA editing enzyme YbaK/EbsC (Cys-tRNA(Pro) deacylase)
MTEVLHKAQHVPMKHALRRRVSKPKRGVSLISNSNQLRVFVDPDLMQYDPVFEDVWAAAGTWNDDFGADPNDIVRVAGGVVTDQKRG